jgi:hypothetical protein
MGQFGSSPESESAGCDADALATLAGGTEGWTRASQQLDRGALKDGFDPSSLSSSEADGQQQCDCAASIMWQ